MTLTGCSYNFSSLKEEYIVKKTIQAHGNIFPFTFITVSSTFYIKVPFIVSLKIKD